jgi:hypothetical protein
MAIDAKQLIAGWCNPADDLQISGEREEQDTDFVLALQSGGAEIVASVASGSDRLQLSRTVEASGAGSAAEALARLELQRPAPISLTGAGDQVTVRTWIVLDGLTKHSLLGAVSEVARTSAAVQRVVAAAAETAEAGGAASPAQDQAAAQPTAAASEAAVPANAGAATGSPAGAYWSGYQGSGGYPGGAGAVGPLSGSGQGYGQPYGSQSPAQGAWTPGHKVPPPGMQAWAVPDPNSPVIATLGGHLPVQVTEMRGAWARVVCSNGWTGWVDGRLLVAGP